MFLGFAAAGALSVLVSRDFVERHLGGKGVKSVLKASLLGVPMPLCSCGVIPVAASLRRHGAGKGATISFLASTPQTGADCVMATYALLGMVFSVFSVAAAFVTGLVCGLAVDAFDKSPEPGAAVPPPEGCRASGHEPGGKLRQALVFGLVALPRDIARPLVVGLLLSGLIGAVVPENFFADKLGPGIVGMLVMLVVGMPIYVCSIGSIPLAASFIQAGLSPGAALVFLIVGPATNAATISTVWKLLGRRSALIYLAGISACALGFGLLLDMFPAAATTAAAAAAACHEAAGGGASNFWAAALLLLLANGLYGAKLLHALRKAFSRAAPESVAIKVSGMTCEHCAGTVREALLRCPHVAAAEVDLKAGRAVASGAGLRTEALLAAVRQAGFEAEPSA